MISNARQFDATYRSNEDALLAGVSANMIVHTEDEFICSEEDVVQCEDCEAVFHDTRELDDDRLCEHCAGEAAAEKRDLDERRAYWSASR